MPNGHGDGYGTQTTNKKRKNVCVDLDGVIASYDGWKGIDHIGEPLPGAKEFLETLMNDFDVIIHTTRGNTKVNDRTAHELGLIIVKYMNKNDLPWAEIYVGQGKPLAEAYVDDRAVPCRPQENAKAFDEALANVKKLVNVS